MGRTLRLVFETEPGYLVTDIGAAGAVQRRERFVLPAEFERPFLTDIKINGDLVLASSSSPPQHALFRLGDPVTPVDLPDHYYRWVGEDILSSDRTLVRIDPSAAAVERVIQTAAYHAMPYAGGVITGFGAERYDADLDRVYRRTTAPITQAPVVIGDRIYALAYDCESASGVLIADARTGELLHERRGQWRFGELGGPIKVSNTNADSCD